MEAGTTALVITGALIVTIIIVAISSVKSSNLEKIDDLQKQLDIENLYEYPFVAYGTFIRRTAKHPLVERLLKLEEYLGIEYQEKTETTKGYVKKNLKANK